MNLSVISTWNQKYFFSKYFLLMNFMLLLPEPGWTKRKEMECHFTWNWHIFFTAHQRNNGVNNSRVRNCSAFVHIPTHHSGKIGSYDFYDR